MQLRSTDGAGAAPLPQRIVPFYDDEIIAVQQPDGTIHVLFARMCENLGLGRVSQVRRVLRHDVLSEGLVTLTVQTDGGPQDAQCLRLDLLPLWLAGLQARRVKAALQAKLIHYQREAAAVLWQAFKPQLIVDTPAHSAAEPQAIVQLQQIAEMGYAIARMAEQQIDLQRQQGILTTRIDAAARVMRSVQGQLGTVEVRLGLLEDQLHPPAYITEAQATEVSNQVKALAEFLTSTDRAKNHYQGIFAELYRRFGVASYKLIRHEQYAAVLSFLADWQAAASAAH